MIRSVRIVKCLRNRERNFVNLFVSRFIKQGKKDIIYYIFVRVLFFLKKYKRISFNKILSYTINSLKPCIGIRPKFVSGVIYMLPSFIHPFKERTLAISWFFKSLKSQRGIPIAVKLYREFKLCFKNKGGSMQYKLDFYNIIFINRDLLYKFKKK
jgi:ribosomal protein S7